MNYFVLLLILFFEIVAESQDFVIVSVTSFDFFECDAYCKILSKNESEIASIHSENDFNNFLQLRSSMGIDNKECWIGLININGTWEWMDDTIVNFTNWNSDSNSFLDDCTEIQSSSDNNQWNSVQCDKTNDCCVCNGYDTAASVGSTTNGTAMTISDNNENNMNNFDISALFNIDLDETTTYFAILIFILVLSSCCINCLAFLHKTQDGTYDDVKYTSVIVFGLQVFDFYSDVNFCAYLARLSLASEYKGIISANERFLYLILFILSALFILIPWLYNLGFLLFMQKINWMDNVLTASWNRSHRKKLVFATMLSGGIYYSVRVLNSRLFGWKVLDMGLSHRQILYIAQKTVIVNALLENLPQIIIQVIYLIITRHVDIGIALTMALISSSIAFTLAMVSSIMNIMDDLHDETIVLRISAECDNLKLRKLIQPRFRLRSKIRRAIAETMGTEDYGTVQIDSQQILIDMANIVCNVTISVHHFSTSVEIKLTSNKGYSKPVTKLIDGCKKGTLATYLKEILLPKDDQDANVTIRVDVCDVAAVPQDLRKIRALSWDQVRRLTLGNDITVNNTTLNATMSAPDIFATNAYGNDMNGNENKNENNNNGYLAFDASRSVNVSTPPFGVMSSTNSVVSSPHTVNNEARLALDRTVRSESTTDRIDTRSPHLKDRINNDLTMKYSKSAVALPLSSGKWKDKWSKAETEMMSMTVNGGNGNSSANYSMVLTGSYDPNMNMPEKNDNDNDNNNYNGNQHKMHKSSTNIDDFYPNGSRQVTKKRTKTRSEGHIDITTLQIKSALNVNIKPRAGNEDELLESAVTDPGFSDSESEKSETENDPESDSAVPMNLVVGSPLNRDSTLGSPENQDNEFPK